MALPSLLFLVPIIRLITSLLILKFQTDFISVYLGFLFSDRSKYLQINRSVYSKCCSSLRHFLFSPPGKDISL